MAFFQAGVLASGADIATQLMEHSTKAPPSSLADRIAPILQSLHLVATPEPVIVAHVLAMATVASTMSGAANAVWLKQLEQAFPGRAAKEVMSKTLIHAVLLASIINSACAERRASNEQDARFDPLPPPLDTILTLILSLSLSLSACPPLPTRFRPDRRPPLHPLLRRWCAAASL